MEQRLKLILREEYLFLTIKAIFLALLFSQISFWLFFVLALFFFFYGQQNSSFVFFKTFLVFVFSSGMAISLFPEYWHVLSFIVFLGFLAILGLRSLVFVRKKEIYRALNFVTATICFLVFFWADFFSTTHLIRFIFLSLGIFWLFEDLFSLYLQNEERKVFYAAFSALVSAETIFALRFLPIGVVSLSVIALTFFAGAQEFVFAAIDKKASKRRILSIFTLFVTMLLLVFAFSGWNVN